MRIYYISKKNILYDLTSLIYGLHTSCTGVLKPRIISLSKVTLSFLHIVYYRLLYGDKGFFIKACQVNTLPNGKHE